MHKPLANPEIRRLKAAAQRLDPLLKIGKAGLSDGFVQSVNDALSHHELVKIKFVEFKDQKKDLAPQLPEAIRRIISANTILIGIIFSTSSGRFGSCCSDGKDSGNRAHRS